MTSKPMWDCMTWGQLKERLKDVPDDAIIVGEFAEEFEFNELGDIKILPAGDYAVRLEPDLPSICAMPACVILYGGQVVNAEYALDDRYDLHVLKVTPGDY